MARTITDLHPRLQEKIAELKKLCGQQGLTIGIGECLRTVAEQNELYAQGRTAPGSIVTNAPGTSYSSQHQWGIAFDFFRNDGTGAYNEEGGFFERVGAIAKSIGLGWGGDWTSIKDRPHLYLPDWGSTTTSLRSSYGSPDRFRSTWRTTGGTAGKPEETKPSAPSPAAPSGSKNPVISAGQANANRFAGCGIQEDGIRGAATKKAGIKVLQKAMNLDYGCGLNLDGIWGPKSEAALGRHTVRNGETQYLVTALEILLQLKGQDPGGVETPGKFRGGLEAALRAYQSKQGLKSDGIAGPATFHRLIAS